MGLFEELGPEELNDCRQEKRRFMSRPGAKQWHSDITRTHLRHFQTEILVLCHMFLTLVGVRKKQRVAPINDSTPVLPLPEGPAVDVSVSTPVGASRIPASDWQRGSKGDVMSLMPWCPHTSTLGGFVYLHLALEPCPRCFCRYSEALPKPVTTLRIDQWPRKAVWSARFICNDRPLAVKSKSKSYPSLGETRCVLFSSSEHVWQNHSQYHALCCVYFRPRHDCDGTLDNVVAISQHVAFQVLLVWTTHHARNS